MERAPEAVLKAAISSVVSSLPSHQSDVPQSFVPAASFQGIKPGYFFSTGLQGVGYYADPAQPVVSQTAAPAEKPPKLSAEQLLEQAEAELGEQVDLTDGRGLKRLVLSFQRKYNVNMEMRMKHADAPDKFMESEVDLDEEVQRLVAVAGSPELYPELIRLGAVPLLLALLQHENADIAADAIQLFKELTDADALNDLEEEAKALVEAIVEANGLELLVQRMVQFNEKLQDDATAIFNALNIIENLVEVDLKVAELFFQRTKLLKWLLGRIRQREFDSNKQYASEVLAILLQSSPANQQALVDADGIELLLQAIAPYKNRDPGTEDEVEHAGNLVGALCSCLLLPATRSVFVAAEGVELMLLILKQKRRARTGALKALDFALMRCVPACERFVNVQGLRTLFPLFMGKNKLRRPSGEEGEEQEEEDRCVSVIANLLLALQRGTRRDRVAAKFVENEFEKCDRLLEIYLRLIQHVQAEEEDIASDEDEEGRLAARMSAGLFTLQQCAIIVANLWTIGDRGVQKRVLQLLHQQGQTLGGVREAVAEYVNASDAAAMGEDAAEAARQRVHLQALLREMGQAAPEAAPPPAGGRPTSPALPNGNAGAREAAVHQGATSLANGVATGLDAPEPDPFGLGDMDMDREAVPAAAATSSRAEKHHAQYARLGPEADGLPSLLEAGDEPPSTVKDSEQRATEHDRAKADHRKDEREHGERHEHRDRDAPKDRDRERHKHRDRDHERDRGHEKRHKEHKRRREEHAGSSRKKERHS